MGAADGKIPPENGGGAAGRRKSRAKTGVDNSKICAIIQHIKATKQTCDGEQYPVQITFQRVPDGEIGTGDGWRMDFGGRIERHGQVETDGNPTRYPSGRV